MAKMIYPFLFTGLIHQMRHGILKLVTVVL